jgi:membrane protein DedA with SNARE-associated domain
MGAQTMNKDTPFSWIAGVVIVVGWTAPLWLGGQVFREHTELALLTLLVIPALAVIAANWANDRWWQR